MFIDSLVHGGATLSVHTPRAFTDPLERCRLKNTTFTDKSLLMSTTTSKCPTWVVSSEALPSPMTVNLQAEHAQNGLHHNDHMILVMINATRKEEHADLSYSPIEIHISDAVTLKNVSPRRASSKLHDPNTIFTKKTAFTTTIMIERRSAGRR